MENCFWSGFTQQNSVFCERQLCTWIQQPANTWSNIGYLIAAILIFRSKQQGPERTFFFWSSLVLFLGSTFFHLSGTHIGKMLDVGAMLVLSMGICTLSVQRWHVWPKEKALSFYFIGLTLSLAFLFIMGFGNIPFALELFIAVVLEIRMMKQGRSELVGKRLLWTCAVQFVAFVFLIMDITRVWCDPDNHFINGHAVWHLLSGLSIYLLFLARRTR